jgi:alkylated DNA repair dioxygenase AlkB
MNFRYRLSSNTWATFAMILMAGSAALVTGRPARGQGAGGDLQARVGELKESMAKNKAALAQYTWKETVKIILKGEEKKTENFQVHQGPDGKPVKTPLDPAPAAQQASGGRGGRLKEHVVEKKKEEYKEYADKMKELAQHYVPPDKEAIQEAVQKGNVSIAPGGDVPGEVNLVIHNYYKDGDSVTLRFDKNQKQLAAISIASYMDDPKDAMNLTVAFAKLPDGTNHVSTTTIEGVSKQLTVNTTNSDYQKM